MQNVLNLYKPIGITPLQLIEKFRKENPQYQNQKLGYAGRLDPMAEGVLLVLVGEENKKRKEYERLKKEYELDVLFGIKTDSYDVLGRILNHCHSGEERLQNHKRNGSWTSQDDEDNIRELIKNYFGKHLQEYPPYSSPRVKGKPLFWWAREGRLSEIEIPKKEIEIYDFRIQSEYSISSEELSNIIFERINKVEGIFRQKEIIKGWEKFFKQNTKNSFHIVKFVIFCSSGTYVRSIANEMGGTALNIKRIKVGEYTVEDSLKI